MGKNPSFPFYPSDWTRDLDDQDLEIEGAWIRICCRLWWAETRGEMTKPIKEWARILRKTEQKTIKILKILIEKRIASGEVLDNQIDNQNATIINRRMSRYDEISKIRQQVGKLGGNPVLKKTSNRLLNQNPNQKRLPSSSFSSSSSKNKTYSPNSDEFRLSSLLFSKIKSRNENHKQPNMNSWAKHIDLMLRIDKREIQEIEKVIEWCQNDPFWQNNILSTGKLREQYDQLVLKMQNPFKEKSPLGSFFDD